jgi:protein-L-isoaspartate(D-aspartate) O-methyltransferase
LTFAAESSVHPHVSARRPARFPGMRAAGKAGALMAGRVVRETVTLAGRAERARVARAFVGGVLGPGHPCGDSAVLLVSELFSNSVRHSSSGVPGETVTVAVRAQDGVVLLATLAGPGGHVTTIDIDPEVSAQAAANLERAGFPGVHVATADAGLGVPDNAPYDRAIVTIGSLDVPPAWFGQLRLGGRLVVPLRWRGQTQSVALVLGEDGILRSDSVFLCGFVPMIGQDWERSAALDSGDLVHLYWDADQDISPDRLSGVLDRPRTRIDSGTTVGPMESLDPIWVRATATDPAVCRISAEPAAVTSGMCTPVVKSRTLALAEDDSIAYLAVQRLQAPEPSSRTGAIGHGPNGASLAERLCRHIDTWGADRTAKPSITIYPHSAPQTAGAQVIRREHCEMTVVY